MKLLIKLAIIGLLANAAFHLMTVYLAHYRFTDAVHESSQFGNDKSMDALRARVLRLASDYDIPLGDDDFTIKRDMYHTIVDGAYSRTVDLAPGYSRPWHFTFHVDTFSEAPMTGDKP